MFKKQLLCIAIPAVAMLFVFQVPRRLSWAKPIAPPREEMIAIVGATLIDGSGRTPQRNSAVIIKGDSIVAAGQRERIKIPKEARLIDAKGLMLAPGFIDTHNHSDRGFDNDPAAITLVSQGITTVVVGQDGGSEFPIGEFLKKLDRSPSALNVLTFVGHATVRSKVMGKDTSRTARETEIDQMKSLVEQAMQEGAFGLSSGLEYETGKPATTEEVISLAQVAGRHGGIYISHIRDEADKLLKRSRRQFRSGAKLACPYRSLISSLARSRFGEKRMRRSLLSIKPANVGRM